MLCTVGEVVDHDGGDRQRGKCLEDYQEPCPGGAILLLQAAVPPPERRVGARADMRGERHRDQQIATVLVSLERGVFRPQVTCRHRRSARTESML